MALDLSANANSTGGTAPGGTTPSYLQQQPQPNASPAGGINNMIRALLSGNDAYQASHPGGMPPALSAGSPIPGAAGPTSVGGPMGPSPIAGATMPTDPSTMTGSLGQTGFQPQPTVAAPMAPPPPGPPGPLMAGNQGPWNGGTPPLGGFGGMGGVDPATAALMSPIPGM